MIIVLPHRRPYDWPAMLRFFAARAIPGLEVVTGDRYTRTIEIEGTAGVITVDGDLRVETDMPSPARQEITARLRRMFDADADPAVINAHLSKDPLLAPLVAARPGLRVPGAWDEFELAVRAVLGQQITVAAAIKLAAMLVARYGRGNLFPRPEELAIDLSTLPMPRSRSAALTSLAKAYSLSSRASVEGPGRGGRRGGRATRPPGSLDYARDDKRLRELPGIGEWTAQYIAMRALRDPDAFPASDIGLLRALADAQGRRPTPKELLTMAERWRPWRAYAAQHLWSA